MSLHERIAAALGWTVKDAQSLSLASLREMVRPVSPKLTHELTVAIEGGTLISEPAESPTITDLDIGSPEPFCACGRRVSQCDHSRKGCNTSVKP